MSSLRGLGPVPKKSKAEEIRRQVIVEKREKTLWKWFSLYIRIRDTVALGFGKCCTCDTRDHYKKMDAGHFLSRRHNAVKYDERNVHLQCVHCNQHLSGNAKEYHIFMLNTYGQEVIDELESRKKAITRIQIWEMEAMISEYRSKAKEIARDRGIPIPK